MMHSIAALELAERILNDDLKIMNPITCWYYVMVGPEDFGCWELSLIC